MQSEDLVAVWNVALSDGIHRVEFEHGTTTGKRILRVDGKEIHRENWMFKLVGTEAFKVGGKRCCVHIDAIGGFAYEYRLDVEGKPLEKFTENIKKVVKTWNVVLNGTPYRICFEKDTVTVHVNGQIVETCEEFVDEGAETNFEIPGASNHNAKIIAVSSGRQSQGIVHTLIINDEVVPESINS
ncbi:fas apoptotic inhibitory molecule 1-like isoform X2 [Lineus longissimus]|uniref:fas apoptotic inhibitory molecule 1-like isoform X2 n=1 Tax=Lineus longissimus TaxID=88925 RepID=UPI002B4ED86C